MRKILSLSVLLVLAGAVHAQQIPFYCQYYINPFVYNPAYTGNGPEWNTYLVHRNQWTGFPGAPVTSALTIDGPVKDKKAGVGLSLYNDITGITRRVGIYGNYSYRMNLTENSRLYMGLAIGVLDNRIDFSKQKVRDVNEPTLENQFDNKTILDGNFGMKFEYRNLELSAAVPQIMGNSLSYVSLTDARSYYSLYRHYLGTVKYNFNINRERNIVAYPLVMARVMPGVPVQYDASMVVDWEKVGWLGVSYKNEYAVGFNAGVRLNGLSIGYVYDFITSPIGAYSGASSEILLGYSFRLQEKSKNPDKEYDRRIDLLAKKVKELEEESQKDKSEIDSLKNKLDAIEFSKDLSPQVGRSYILTNVHFATKSYELNKKSMKILNDLVEFLEENPNVKIEILGHTDDVGTNENNDILSENRAKSVLNYLVEKGINRDRLSFKAFGESRPLVPGTSVQARALNRRTEFVILSNSK